MNCERFIYSITRIPQLTLIFLSRYEWGLNWQFQWCITLYYIKDGEKERESLTVACWCWERESKNSLDIDIVQISNANLNTHIDMCSRNNSIMIYCKCRSGQTRLSEAFLSHFPVSWHILPSRVHQWILNEYNLNSLII